jgi:hypothetical protein
MNKFVVTSSITRFFALLADTLSPCTPLKPRSTPALKWPSAVLILIAGIMSSSFAAAQTGGNERWFQVELIAFKRQQQNTREQWPTNIKPGYPHNWVELRHATSAIPSDTGSDLTAPASITTPDFAFVVVPDAEHKLARYANALQRDSRFTILFHQAWRQPVTGTRSAKAVVINGGHQYGAHRELEGSFTLSFSQFLQIKTRLWLTQFEANRGQTTADWPLLPPIPRLEVAPDLMASETDQTSVQTTINEEIEEFLPGRIAMMEEDRRVRANELHYFDHPLFGLIVQLTPYEAKPGTP